MVKLWMLLLLSVVTGNVAAQNVLSGTVTDQHDKSPIAGATIYVTDVKKGAITDVDGNFSIGDLPKGKFLVEIKFLGYATVVKEVQVADQTRLDVTLSTVETELNEVVVTGISHSSELKSNPIPITTLNNKQLVENTATNLIDNISRKAGVNQITTGPAISKPVIRGLGYNRIISLNNGIRQEGQQWGDEHGIEMDEFSVDRVEIIKGAGSLMYGSDGLGGVINFLAPNPVAPGTISGKWLSNYQTNNGQFGNSLMNTGNIKGLYWLARVSNKTAHAYSNAYDGKVFNSGFRETDANGYVGVSRAWGYSQLNMTVFNQQLGLVEGDRDADGRFTRLTNDNGVAEDVTVSDRELNSYHLFVPRQTIHHAGLSNTTNIYAGTSRFQLNVGYQRNQRQEFGEVLNEDQKDLYFDLHTLTYNLIYFLPENNGWEASAGTSGMRQENENKGLQFLIPQYHFFDWGAFAFAKKHIGALEVSGGARVDHRNVSIDGLYLDATGAPTNDATQQQKFKAGDLSFSNYSASAGATYQLSSQWSVKANVSRGFRAPNIAELASNGRHEGTLRYEYGNYNLRAENSFQKDVGISFNSKHISADLSAFQNTIHHYIYTEKLRSKAGTDSIPDPSEPVPAYQYVQGEAQLTGGELFIDVHPHPWDWLHFENGFSFVNALNKSQAGNDSTKYLPYIPPAKLQSELRATIAFKNTRLANTFVRTELQHYWQQGRVLLENHTETPTPSYTLWNASMGTDVVNTKGVTVFSFYFTVTNIMNVAYQNHLSRLKYAAENPITGRNGVFNMGRSFSFKLVVPIRFR